MTCLSLVRRSAAPAGDDGHPQSVTSPAQRSSTAWLRTLLDGDATLLQFARFALTGGASTTVQLALFALVAPVGTLLANVVAWAVSTALANDLHRRRTFHAGQRVSWLAAQWEGGALALLGLLISSGVLTVLAVTAPGAGVAVQAALVLSVNVTVGVLRFFALRWAFLVRPRRSS